MNKRTENREARRQAILAAAKALFAERGFHAAGMAEIAARAGLTPANLYRYFPAKAAIVRAIADAQRERMVARIEQALTVPDAGAALADLLAYFMAEARDLAMSRLWLEILAETARNPDVRRLVEADDAAVKAGFGAILARGRAAGTMRADLDPGATVVWLVTLLDGAAGRMAIEPDYDLEGATATFLALVRQALTPAGPGA